MAACDRPAHRQGGAPKKTTRAANREFGGKLCGPEDFFRSLAEKGKREIGCKPRNGPTPLEIDGDQLRQAMVSSEP